MRTSGMPDNSKKGWFSNSEHLNIVSIVPLIRYWSLITGSWGGGGATKREGGGACEVLPLRKGGLENVLAMLRGGGGKDTKSFGIVLTRDLLFSHFVTPPPSL